MKIIPSLSFNGQCREAFEFYARVLGGEIISAFPYGEGPPDMPVGPQYKDWLMHAWLQIGDQAIMGADMDKDWAPNIDKPKNGFDVAVHTDDVDEARAWFEGLSEGGRVIMPFQATFWSPGYGSFIDKFGIPWMVNTNGQPQA
ncbi:VOC family protein [Brevundimonas aveniformis]|uniref:VOC family protein n=1 Tax=Brevundimonas aveniformis TaxID=370977 RepID=UPI0024932CB1|nr:VOC family protein [Brevundimonas aveniformis]